MVTVELVWVQALYYSLRTFLLSTKDGAHKVVAAQRAKAAAEAAAAQAAAAAGQPRPGAPGQPVTKARQNPVVLLLSRLASFSAAHVLRHASPTSLPKRGAALMEDCASCSSACLSLNAYCGMSGTCGAPTGVLNFGRVNRHLPGMPHPHKWQPLQVEGGTAPAAGPAPMAVDGAAPAVPAIISGPGRPAAGAVLTAAAGMARHVNSFTLSCAV